MCKLRRKAAHGSVWNVDVCSWGVGVSYMSVAPLQREIVSGGKMLSKDR